MVFNADIPPASLPPFFPPPLCSLCPLWLKISRFPGAKIFTNHWKMTKKFFQSLEKMG